MSKYKFIFLSAFFVISSAFVSTKIEAKHHHHHSRSRTHFSFGISGGCVSPQRETYVIERHYPAYVTPYVEERVYVPARPYYEERYVVPSYRERIIVQPRVNFGWFFGFGR